MKIDADSVTKENVLEQLKRLKTDMQESRNRWNTS